MKTQISFKRTICTSILLPPLFLFALSATLHAQFEITTNNGTITITKYIGPGGSVTIPTTINGLPVSTIGDSAFANKTALNGVMIPDSVTSIGDSAFFNCIALTSLTIGNSVIKIGDSAFYFCCLLNVTIPGSVTSIGKGAFEDCLLRSIRIPNSVTNIGMSAFGRCGSLTAITVDPLNSVYASLDGVLFNKGQTALIQYPGKAAGSYTIPNSVISIEDSAFDNCAYLTSVTIGSSVTSIGDSAFFNCYHLTNARIGGNVISIGDSAFYACTALTAITVDPLNSVYSSLDDVLFNKSLTRLIQYPGSKAGSYTIPNSVKGIGRFCA